MMKEVDKPSEWADPLQSLWQSAPSLINIPNYSFPVDGLHRQQKKQHNTVPGVNLLQCVWLSLPHWASILFCGFPTHLLWEDGVNEPHLLHHFSHLTFPFHPCSQTTHTYLITFLFSYCSLPHRTAFSLCWGVRTLLPKPSFLFWLWHLPLWMLACFLSAL